jgi:hypothetical protein
MARPVIVVSTGRSGSTLLSNMVREHPELLSLSELFIVVAESAFPAGDISGAQFWEILSRPSRGMHALQRSGVTIAELLYRPGPGSRFTADTGIPPVILTTLPHLAEDPEALYDELAAWVPGLDARPVADQYRRLFEWLCRRLDRRVWIERSGASLTMVSMLARQFPEAAVVHLHRDGRASAFSMSRHEGFKLVVFRERPELAPADMWVGGLLNRDAIAGAQVPIEIYGELWSDMIVEGVAGLAELPPDRVMSMSYESLTVAPEHELRRLATFMGIEPDRGWLERAVAMARPHRPMWEALPEPERGRLVEACAPGMDLLYRSWP